MEQQPPPSNDERCVDLMVSRCHKLFLPCVRLENDRLVPLAPTGAEIPRAFLSSPALFHIINRAAAHLNAMQLGDAIHLFDGCWLLTLDASYRPGSALALMLTEPALHSPQFAEICAEANIEPAAMRGLLQPWVRHAMHGPDRLASLIRWTREDIEAADRQDGLLREFSDKLIQSYEETHVLFRIMRFMASSGSPRQQVQLVCNQILQILPFRWVAVLFKNQDAVESSLRDQLVLAGDAPCDAREFRAELSALLETQNGDNWTRVLYPEDNLLAGLVQGEVACDPITYNNTVVGALVAGNKNTKGSDTAIASPEIQFIDAVADFLGTFHENAVRFAEQQALFMGSLQALTAAIDAKDPYTRGHSERVAFLSGALAISLGLGEQTAERIRIAGLVHDIGKIGVPEAILCKAGRLTDDEFEAIKRHPEIGHRILRDIVPFQDLLPGVLHHHERWDGRGYPHKLAGDKIPMIARIIGLADTFDAMSSTRSYRPALPRDHVIREIERNAGSQFDPRIVEAFRHVDLAGYDDLLAKRPIVAEPPSISLAA